jgi:hypothetical protein
MLVQFQHCGFSSAKGVPSCFELRKSINDSAWQKKKRTHVDKSAHLWDRFFPESKTTNPNRRPAKFNTQTDTKHPQHAGSL